MTSRCQISRNCTHGREQNAKMMHENIKIKGRKMVMRLMIYLYSQELSKTQPEELNTKSEKQEQK